MSKLRLRAVLCSVGVFLIAATALVAFRPHGLKAGTDESAQKSSENQTVTKKRWSIRSPFSRTRVANKKKSNAVASQTNKRSTNKRGTNRVQLISSEKVVKRQRARNVSQKKARANDTNYVRKPSMRQIRRSYRPVRRQKKSLLTKTKDFFSSKIPGLRKKNTRKPRNTRFAQSSQQQTRSRKTQSRKSGIRFASASNRKTTARKKTVQNRTRKTQKSEVLEHLEKLYARDGLPMPEMDMKKMGQRNSQDEDPLVNNPFAKLANEMSRKNLKANPKGDSKPIYAGPLNDTIQKNGKLAGQKNAARNPFATFDRKTDRKGDNPFNATKKEEKKPVIVLAEQKRVSPLKKHMSSLKKVTPTETEKKTAIGFQGYCPVALKDSRKKIAVNPKLVSVHEGVLYSFSSEQARTKFLDAPVRYAAVMGGTDMIPLIEHGQTIEGSLQHCCWFRGRLYLFSSQESLKTFLDRPSQYATDVVR